MKRVAVIMTALLLAISMLVPSLAAGDSSTYFVNPQGGKFYHVRKNCEAVGEQYRAGMLSITPGQMAQGSYSNLLPCPICFPDNTPMVTPENPYVMSYVGPYNTAQDGVMISTAGTYRAGEELWPGIYTAEADLQCSGTLIIRTAENQPLYSYPLQAGAVYTFYLGENMYVSLPEHCNLHKLVENPQFQDDYEKVSIRQRRYLTMAEIPGKKYYVTNLPGEKGYFVVSSILSETGNEEPVRVDVTDGDLFQLVLQQQDNVFVEFVNCVVWPCEPGQG